MAMKSDPITGSTIRWTFDDGPTAGKTFEHVFEADGGVSYRIVDQEKAAKSTREDKYEVAPLSESVCAVSYLASSGYTLTTVLDFSSQRCVAFASNEERLTIQRGTFTVESTEGSSPTQRSIPAARPARSRAGEH
jgi:hypothetical protein